MSDKINFHKDSGLVVYGSTFDNGVELYDAALEFAERIDRECDGSEIEIFYRPELECQILIKGYAYDAEVHFERTLTLDELCKIAEEIK